MSRASKVANAIPRYYQLGHEAEEFVVPESCIESHEQFLMISKHAPHAIFYDPFLGGDVYWVIEETAEDVYHNLVVFGTAQLNIADGDVLFYSRSYKEVVEGYWKGKQLPIPDYSISIIQTKSVMPYYSVQLRLCNQKSIVEQRMKTPSDSPYEIIGVINVFQSQFPKSEKFSTYINKKLKSNIPGIEEDEDLHAMYILCILISFVAFFCLFFSISYK